jgi:hypothetical protein
MTNRPLVFQALAAVAISAIALLAHPRASGAATTPDSCIDGCCACDEDSPACFDSNGFTDDIYADCGLIGCGDPTRCVEHDVADCGDSSTYFECSPP